MSLFQHPEVELYQKDAKGDLRIWAIKQENCDIVIKHGVLNGAMQEVRETIRRGKGNRSIQAQIVSRIQSRISKQRQKGYKNSIKEAESRTNAIGLIRPMLAQRYNETKHRLLDDAYVQYKYDGNRCLITNVNGELIAYSRNGKTIGSIGHILKDIEIPEGVTLDGELYSHGFSLQTLVSWIKRKQANSYRLKYHVYDVYAPSVFSERLELLKTFALGSSAEIVPTVPLREATSIQKLFTRAKEEGYEGLIIRTNDSPYEDGKRSKSLLKIKEFLDDEFVVVDVLTSEKSERIVLTCLANNGRLFKVSPPGTLQQRQKVDESYIGQTVRVEYSMLTAEGVPFHGIATEWRDKAAE